MSLIPFEILEITSEMRGSKEPLGSKSKFWFLHQGDPWLFKEARKNTGEDWSEKIGSEIARLLGLPTHDTELAVWNGKRGCAVKSFLSSSQFSLEHGNELLAGLINDYDPKKEQKQSDHTLENIFKVMEHLFGARTSEYDNTILQMVGYLFFDALIGNTDRHHQNWGVLKRRSIASDSFEISDAPTICLAPTFDHASSLGRELSDARREEFLALPKRLERYTRKARGGIYEDATARYGLSPFALAMALALRLPVPFRHWQEQLRKIDLTRIKIFLDRIPDERIGASGRNFSLALVVQNRNLLLNISTEK